jgi:hypothetical protein
VIVKINLKSLKTRYPQLERVKINDDEFHAYLASIQVNRSLIVPSTQDIISAPFAIELNNLCLALKAFGFNEEKLDTLLHRFKGELQRINAYFHEAPGSLGSIPLRVALLLRQKMEEIAFLLSKTESSLRPAALSMVSQDAYACADGTLQNLESLLRHLAGTSGTLDYFIAEAKRELIEAKLQEEYRKKTSQNSEPLPWVKKYM